MTDQAKDHNWIKYFADDLTTGHFGRKSQQYLEQYKDGPRFADLTEAVSAHNACRYIESGLRFDDWADDYQERLKAKAKIVRRDLAKYFRAFEPEGLLEQAIGIAWMLVDDFHRLLHEFNMYNRIDADTFTNYAEQLPLQQLLASQPIVERYDQYLRQRMLDNPLSAEVIISHHLAARDSSSPSVFVPKLSNLDMNKLLEGYVEHSQANANFLTLLVNASKSAGLPVSAEVKLAAQKHVSALERKMMVDGASGLTAQYSMAWGDAPDLSIENESGDIRLHIQYDKNWFEDNLDYPTILGNFIHIFEYVNRMCIIELVGRTSQVSALEAAIGLHGKEDYQTRGSFQQKHILSMMQLAMYVSLLRSHNITLEDVIDWFFSDYLKQQFEADGFRINMPSQSTSPSERCRLLLVQMESALKQYELYATKGKIDHELLDLSSDLTRFDGMPALAPDKYVYLEDEDGGAAERICFNLFSDQSSLAYIARPTNASTHSLYELLQQETVLLGDFGPTDQDRLRYLAGHSVVSLEDGKIGLVQPRAAILYWLYFSGPLNTYRIPGDLPEVEAMIDEALLCKGSSLFARPEVDYLNYYLNSAGPKNGPQLRNRYLHGKFVALDDQQHQENYLLLLRTFILMIIKINDEFCLADA